LLQSVIEKTSINLFIYQISGLYLYITFWNASRSSAVAVIADRTAYESTTYGISLVVNHIKPVSFTSWRTTGAIANDPIQRVDR